jgi:hypothetical protein
MDSKKVIYYLKRHIFGIVGLLLAVGFVVGGFVWNGKTTKSIEDANAVYDAALANRDKIQNAQIKVDIKNVEVLGQVADEYEDFTKKAGEVFVTQQIVPKTSNDFMNYMTQSIVVLNRKATNNLVKVPNDLLKRSDINFSFTFAPLMEAAEISKDKIPELQIQLEDIKEICDVLFENRIQSLELLQRNRVTDEDRRAGASPNYLDTRLTYTNSISVVRPYTVKFRCLSDGVAMALSGFAKKKTFYVVRTMEVTPAGASSASAAGGSGGYDPESGGGSSGVNPEGGSGGPSSGGFGAGSGGAGSGGGPPGMGAPSGGTATTQVVFPPPYIRYLVQQGLTAFPATNVVGETLLEVVLELDAVRRTVNPAGPGPAGQ